MSQYYILAVHSGAWSRRTSRRVSSEPYRSVHGTDDIRLEVHTDNLDSEQPGTVVKARIIVIKGRESLRSIIR